MDIGYKLRRRKNPQNIQGKNKYKNVLNLPEVSQNDEQVDRSMEKRRFYM